MNKKQKIVVVIVALISVFLATLFYGLGMSYYVPIQYRLLKNCFFSTTKTGSDPLLNFAFGFRDTSYCIVDPAPNSNTPRTLSVYHRGFILANSPEAEFALIHVNLSLDKKDRLSVDESLKRKQESGFSISRYENKHRFPVIEYWKEGSMRRAEVIHPYEHTRAYISMNSEDSNIPIFREIIDSFTLWAFKNELDRQ